MAGENLRLRLKIQFAIRIKASHGSDSGSERALQPWPEGKRLTTPWYPIRDAVAARPPKPITKRTNDGAEGTTGSADKKNRTPADDPGREQPVDNLETKRFSDPVFGGWPTLEVPIPTHGKASQPADQQESERRQKDTSQPQWQASSSMDVSSTRRQPRHAVAKAARRTHHIGDKGKDISIAKRQAACRHSKPSGRMGRRNGGPAGSGRARAG